MKAHIVGGGFGGLAAAALLIRNAAVPGQDITIYEANDRMGGGFFLDGSAQSGYSLPGSIFDKEFRCAFDLLATIPTEDDAKISVKEQFFTFNTDHPFDDRVHIIDSDLRTVHGPRFGLSLWDGLALARLSLTPEAWLNGRRIEEFFSPRFFSTEFWLLWSTLMGSLPQHSVIEFRRYMNRFVYLFPDLSTMAHVLRSPFNQHEAFIKPLLAWLRVRGVNFLTGAFVQDIGFEPSPGRMTVNRLDYQRYGDATTVAVAPEDIVLVTTGSQAADLSAGSMTAAPRPQESGRSWALWKRLAKGRKEFGNPDTFFGAAKVADSRWVTFTVTTTGTEFIDQMSNLTHSKTGSGGLLTLKDSGWVLSLSIFLQPEILDQPQGTYVWWGYGLYPEHIGTYVKKRMDQCTGTEILRGIAAPSSVRRDGSDHEVVDLHSLQHALREQHLAAARPRRQAPRGSRRVDQPRAHRSICGGSAGYRVYVRIFDPHGVGSDSSPAQARPCAAARLSGPVRSEGGVGRFEGVSGSGVVGGDDEGGTVPPHQRAGRRPLPHSPPTLRLITSFIMNEILC